MRLWTTDREAVGQRNSASEGKYILSVQEVSQFYTQKVLCVDCVNLNAKIF